LALFLSAIISATVLFFRFSILTGTISSSTEATEAIETPIFLAAERNSEENK